MHRNAPLTPEGRLRLRRLIDDGWTVASAAESHSVGEAAAGHPSYESHSTRSKAGTTRAIPPGLLNARKSP